MLGLNKNDDTHKKTFGILRKTNEQTPIHAGFHEILRVRLRINTEMGLNDGVRCKQRFFSAFFFCFMLRSSVRICLEIVDGDAILSDEKRERIIRWKIFDRCQINDGVDAERKSFFLPP